MARARSPERQQFYADIITTATEGGTNYWAYSRNYSWSHDDPGVTTVQYCDMELEGTDEEEWHTCNLDTISKAFSIINKMSATDLKLPERTRRRYQDAYKEMDAGDLDAGDADTIVQIGMFGEVRYG